MNVRGRKLIILIGLFFLLAPSATFAITDEDIAAREERERCCCSNEARSNNCTKQNSACSAPTPYQAPLDRCVTPTQTTEQQVQTRLVAPTLQIPIPTIKPFTVQDVKLEGTVGDRYVVVPFIAQYVVGVYKYGISVAFIVAIVIVMIAGFRWMTSGGNTSVIGQAKEMMATTFIGLVLLLGSYVLLNTINPDLLSAGLVRVKYIEPDILKFEDSGDTDEDLDSSVYTRPEVTCPRNGGAAVIPQIIDSMRGKIAYRFGGKGGSPPYSETNQKYTKYNTTCPTGNICLDCSGFVNFVLRCAGLQAPGGGTKSIFSNSETITSIDPSNETVNGRQLQPGDLLGYLASESSTGVGHVYMYIGNGKLANSKGGDSGRQSGANPIIIDLTSDNKILKHIRRISG